MPGPIIDLKDCTIFLVDKVGSFIGIRLGEGNLTYTNKRNIELRKARGQLWKVREGEQEATEVAFQFVWDDLIAGDDDPPTIEEVLYHEGPAASWQSTSNDPEGPFCVNIQITHEKSCRSPAGITTQKHVITLLDFYHQELTHSLRDGTIDCKGISNRVRPGVLRIDT